MRAPTVARPRLLQAVIDAFQQADVRRKIVFTLSVLVIFRFVANLPLPGIDSATLADIFKSNAVLGFLNIFSGGALRNMSVAALGVYPYVTASIVMQLLVPMVPRLQALTKEGEQGRRQIQIYTHWLTIPMCVVQGYGQLILINNLGGFGGETKIGLTGDALLPTLSMLTTLTAGTMFLVWLGELITEKGIGNGVSVLIFAGIVANIPRMIWTEVYTSTAMTGVVMLVLFIAVILAVIVFFQEAQRRIPVQYSRSLFRGGRMYRQSGQTHIPLRVNSAGMIPLIFAFSIVIFPAYIASMVESGRTGWVADLAGTVQAVFDPSNWGYWIFLFFLVVIFAFFYTMVIFQQQNLAENLQRQGGFIPGIRPGRPTAEYITRVLIRITWAGALFLGVIAVIPYFAAAATGEQSLSLGRGGGLSFGITSAGLIIVVGVVLDTMRQLEAQLLMRQYEGFIR
ncbi:MAG: preprotein translocase subunit SecY [Dehalococcoidia bacterium SM23_28_2]|nr:MAG: preprotein translocase subunit SecY [Dehalococcoidia bacterium SM23_28_2]